jgi:hypothetical protein
MKVDSRNKSMALLNKSFSYSARNFRPLGSRNSFAWRVPVLLSVAMDVFSAVICEHGRAMDLLRSTFSFSRRPATTAMSRNALRNGASGLRKKAMQQRDWLTA